MRAQLLTAAVLMAMASVPRREDDFEIVVTGDPYRDRYPIRPDVYDDVCLTSERPPAPVLAVVQERDLNATDHERLRLAAEKRARKAARQSKGMDRV